jgi:hypothetical protein
MRHLVLLLSILFAPSANFAQRLKAGPMVGHVHMMEANIWLQTTPPGAQVQIAYWDTTGVGTNRGLASPFRLPILRSSKRKKSGFGAPTRPSFRWQWAVVLISTTLFTIGPASPTAPVMASLKRSGKSNQTSCFGSAIITITARLIGIAKPECVTELHARARSRKCSRSLQPRNITPFGTTTTSDRMILTAHMC